MAASLHERGNLVCSMQSTSTFVSVLQCDIAGCATVTGQTNVSLGMQVYSVTVSPFFGVQAPGPSPQLHGDLGINFSCSPANTHHLIDAAVNEVHRLQVCSNMIHVLTCQIELICCRIHSWIHLLVIGLMYKLVYRANPHDCQQTDYNPVLDASCCVYMLLTAQKICCHLDPIPSEPSMSAATGFLDQ